MQAHSQHSKILPLAAARKSKNQQAPHDGIFACPNVSKAAAAFPFYWQKCSAAAQACFCIKVEKQAVLTLCLKNRAVQTKHIDPAEKDPQSLEKF